MRQWPTASGRAGQRRKRRKNLGLVPSASNGIWVSRGSSSAMDPNSIRMRRNFRQLVFEFCNTINGKPPCRA